MARVNDVRDLLFPVEVHPIFVSRKTAAGVDRIRVINRKALINGKTGHVLGIVSRDYPLVTNEQALGWAQQCCKAAFPDTSEAEWQVHAADGPSTASYCHIDLIHNSGAMNFALVPARARPDVFGPFVRVTNSYNALRALVFDIGFHRKVCQNGLILPRSVVQFRFSHERSQLRSIRFDIDAEGLTRLTQTFKKSVSRLTDCNVPEALFLTIVSCALSVRPPVEDLSVLSKELAQAWGSLRDAITALARKYVSELGANAYALLNTITDFASQPPANTWVRRDRHALQRLAGRWLSEFSSECERESFNVTAYAQRLSAEIPQT